MDREEQPEQDESGSEVTPVPGEQVGGEPTDSQVEEWIFEIANDISKVRNRPVLLLLYPSGGMIRPPHSVEVYQKFMDNPDIKNLDIILHSPGGDIHEAHDMIKVCRSYTDDEVSVIVPQRAMSAATLMALGADKVYLSKIGNLGPLDPQVQHPEKKDYIPVRAVSEIPDVLEKGLQSVTSDVQDDLKGQSIIKPIAEQVDPYMLAGHEETPEVAKRYGRKLLTRRNISEQIAERCLETLLEFPSHTFNIDLHEIQANPSLANAIDASDISELTNGRELEERLILLLNFFLLWDYKYLKQGEPRVDPKIEIFHPDGSQQTLDEVETDDDGAEEASESLDEESEVNNDVAQEE